MFKAISLEEIKDNAFKLIGEDWMLISAEKEGKVNTMTASWGGIGIMWGKKVAYVAIRPQRYTKEFIDSSKGFSLSFLPDNFRDKLNYLGTVSGRNEDKVQKSGLKVLTEENIPYFEESRLVLLCQKLFAQDFTPESFLEEGIKDSFYAKNDYHTLYIAEIKKALIK